jgi:hypothetical protein
MKKDLKRKMKRKQQQQQKQKHAEFLEFLYKLRKEDPELYNVMPFDNSNEPKPDPMNMPIEDLLDFLSK